MWMCADFMHGKFDRSPAVLQWLVANDLDKHDIHMYICLFQTLTSLCYSFHVTFHLYALVKCSVSMHILVKLLYVCEHIFTGIDKPQIFFSKLELTCWSTKFFHLKQFAIYGIVLLSKQGQYLCKWGLISLIKCFKKVFLKI